MVDFDSNKPDRYEERRTEERRTESKRQVEKRMQREPMKTFEAKLSEKAAQEKQTKESAFRNLHDLKKSKEEKQSLLDRIIGVAKDKNKEAEKQRVHAVHKQGKDEQKKETKKRMVGEDFEAQDQKDTKKEKASQKTDKKQSEISQEGHRRVAEKEEGREGGSGSFGGGASQDESDSNERSFGGQPGSQKNKNAKEKFGFSKKQDTGFVNKLSGDSASSSGGFQGNARSFTNENLNQIVSAVQLGINEKGEEEFVVELGDEYFDGLKIAATRTDQGVVVKFTCPNMSVKSTFLKYRLQVYQQLKSKNISVFRVDVV